MDLNFRLFNCDRTYNLDKVKELISKVRSTATVEQRYFGLPRMKDLCNELNEGGKLSGYAVFVVHAHESRLSLNEQNAGIGYAKLYRTLLDVMDGRVLIVIGGDDNYKEDEQDESFLSKWVWRKICSQFTEDYMNGIKSFIFSWEEKHNPIHEEALEFYLDPNTSAQKFVPCPRPKIPKPPPPNADHNETKDLPRADIGQKRPFDEAFRQLPPPLDDNRTEDISIEEFFKQTASTYAWKNPERVAEVVRQLEELDICTVKLLKDCWEDVKKEVKMTIGIKGGLEAALKNV